MGKKLYAAPVEISPPLKQILLDCIQNHLVLYNYSLDILDTNPNIEFNELKNIIKAKVAEDKVNNGNVNHTLSDALNNDIYYLYNKYRTSELRKKSIADIQYLTFIINGYNGRIMNYNESLKTIRLYKKPGFIHLVKSLPAIDGNEAIYMNLSYSSWKDKFELSLFK